MLSGYRFRFRIEAAGYGASLRSEPEGLSRFSKALSRSYGTGRDVDECRREILARSLDGGLF